MGVVEIARISGARLPDQVVIAAPFLLFRGAFFQFHGLDIHPLGFRELRGAVARGVGRQVGAWAVFGNGVRES